MRCAVLRCKPLQLIEEGHLLDFFLRIFFFDLRFFAGDLGFINFALALVCEVGACTHGKRGSEHSREAGDEDVMLLVVSCACPRRRQFRKTAPRPSFTP